MGNDRNFGYFTGPYSSLIAIPSPNIKIELAEFLPASSLPDLPTKIVTRILDRRINSPSSEAVLEENKDNRKQ